MKNCLHCGTPGNGKEIRAGLCSYCKHVVTTHQRNVYKALNNGKMSYCYVCDKLTMDGETFGGVKTENIVCDSVCVKCVADFSVQNHTKVAHRGFEITVFEKPQTCVGTVYYAEDNYGEPKLRRIYFQTIDEAIADQTKNLNACIDQ